MNIPKLTNDMKSVIRSRFRNKKFHSYFEIQKEFDSLWNTAIKPVCGDWGGNPENRKVEKSLSPSVLPFVHYAKSPWYKRIIGIKGYAYLDLDGVAELTSTWLTAAHIIGQSSIESNNVSKSDSSEHELLQAEITKLKNDNAKANSIIETLKEELAKQGNPQKTQQDNHDVEVHKQKLVELVYRIYTDLYKISSEGRSKSDIVLARNTLSQVGLKIIEYQPGINDDLFTIDQVDYIQEEYMELPAIVDKKSREVLFEGKVYTPTQNKK